MQGEDMTDQNAPAADSTLTPEQFEEAMNQALFDGPVMMDFDEAQAAYAQCLHYAAEHLDDASYCKALVALSEVHMHREQYQHAIILIRLALEVMLQYLPPLHERVGALHYLLAAAYQFNAEYDNACKHWVAVIECFNWLPADAPVLREAAYELYHCRTVQRGMPDPEIHFWETRWRDAA
jgi:tetratricopeptide (TPR) repeat protein